MPKKGLRALSLFSGAGGMDLGVARAGFRILACIESDPHCCETLRNAAQRLSSPPRVIEEDIRKVNPAALLKSLRLKPGSLDLLFGGPPCQAFSQIGKQLALADERGQLLFQIARFAAVFNPKAILVEQVKGLLSAKGNTNQRGEVLHLFLTDLEKLNYIPKWKVLNAADYGVPQLRSRVFIVATRPPNGFVFPPASHCADSGSLPLFAVAPHRTTGEALRGLGRPSLKKTAARLDGHIDVTPSGDRARIHGVPEGAFLAAQAHLPKSQRRNLTKKDTTKYLRLSRSKPANTLRCGEIFFHATQDRYLTPREYLRLHGYPDEYQLLGPIRSRSGRVRDLDQHRQVANSVPPPVAFCLAEALKTSLNHV